MLRTTPMRLIVALLLVTGCGGTSVATPIVIYVTPSPAVATPTTSVPTASPTPTSTAAAPSATPTPSTHDLSVQLTLYDPAFGGNILGYGDTECAGNGHFSDVAPGTQVTIKNAGGTIVGLATFADRGKSVTHDGTWTTECLFASTAPAVPESPFYTVSIGSRDPVQFSLDEIRSHGWLIALSIGSK